MKEKCPSGMTKRKFSDMIYLHVFDNGKRFKEISDLAETYVEVRGDEFKINDDIIISHMNNILVKLGFMKHSSEGILTINGKYPRAGPQILYFISNFIYATKSLLDGIAAILNHYFHLGIDDKQVDLTYKKFKKILRRTDPELKLILDKYKEWLESVGEWRNNVIHKKTLLISFQYSNFSPHDQTELDVTPFEMTNKPVSLAEILKMQTKERKKVLHFKIESFCDEWLTNAESMIKDVFTTLHKRRLI